MQQNRKNIRLQYYNYSKPGTYFITISTKDRKEILSEIIVGTGVLDGPKIQLTYYGQVAEKYIVQMNDYYSHIAVDNFVIMPNHIHLLIHISVDVNQLDYRTDLNKVNNVNSEISKFVSTFKRFCNKEYGKNIWQSRSYDHVVRGERDYAEINDYINNNPGKWIEDRFYQQQDLT